jgi:dihydroxyacetone kinase
VYQATRITFFEKGRLLIVKNYSDAIMNFGNATHLAKEDEIQVEIVQVDNDIAIENSLYTVIKRGFARKILVHK